MLYARAKRASSGSRESKAISMNGDQLSPFIVIISSPVEMSGRIDFCGRIWEAGGMAIGLRAADSDSARAKKRVFFFSTRVEILTA